MKENDIAGILTSTQTIALVGASDKPDRPSYRVMKYLLEQGYHVIPVSPKVAGTTLMGQKGYATLGDVRCGVNFDAPAFKGTGAIIDLLRDRAFTASGLGGFATGWFTFGTLDWTSGANAGRRAEVLAHDLVDGVAVLTLLEAPVRAIAGTDTFIIHAGCDKRIATCGTKFGNVANFRGFPNIPGQDAVLRYATTDGGHEGAVL